MVLTVVSILFIALLSYVNLTVGRNFNFKPDLTLILSHSATVYNIKKCTVA